MDEIEELLSQTNSPILDSNGDGFYAVASTIVSKLKFSNPELGCKSDNVPPSIAKFANIFDNGYLNSSALTFVAFNFERCLNE